LDRSSKFPKIVLAGGLLLILAIYSLAWSGTLHFDDNSNLDGLYGVSDFTSGLQFVLSGESGPTGRPLSLATFALQHESWPDPQPFLVVNTLLHVINGLLCFLLLRRLLGWMLPDARSAEWLAVPIALFWAASPFLASSSLVVVQRMTGLSAFFALLGLNVYTMARTGYRPDSWRSNLWLASIAGTGTLLAGLAKENGFLLPVFLLLIESLLVVNARVTIRPLHKGFFWVVLVAPVALILGLLLYKGLSSAGYLYREYTLAERLLTQPRVLFDYILNLLIPSTESLTPFHDAYAHSTGLLTPATTLLSILGLVVLIVFAWVVRHRWPIVAFGLLFFLAGHLVESTVVPLELYFPHRNYLPAIGLYLAILTLAFTLMDRLYIGLPLRYLGAGGYFLAVIVVLLSGSSLWGDRRMAPEMWYIQNRDSVRASIYLYQHYIAREGLEVSNQFNERLIESHRGNPLFSVQALAICGTNRAQFKEKLARAVDDLEQAQIIGVNETGLIQKFAAVAGNATCQWLGVPEVDKLIAAARREGPAKRIRPSARRELFYAEAQLADKRGNYLTGARALKKALDVEPTIDAVLLVAYFLVEAGERKNAVAFLRDSVNEPRVSWIDRKLWEQRTNKLIRELDQSGIR